MNKQTKTLLAVGVVAVVGYMLWKKSQKPKSFANASGCRKVEYQQRGDDGVLYDICNDGSAVPAKVQRKEKLEIPSRR